jgi:hypothetical protein
MNCANHPDREKVAFCQNCGKPLCQECNRPIGSAVYCEPCLAARLGVNLPPRGAQAGDYSAADPNPGQGASGAQPGSYTYVDPRSGVPVGGVPPMPPPGSANPLLAGFLGLIPGVGAMYNAQYAKGILHLVIFAILISLADNHDIFGLFVAGWVCYMAFEAYQTARARRDGLPLPNPFGLNDIGERLGFDKTWKMGAHPPTPSASGYVAPDPYAGTPQPPYTPPASAGYVPPAQTWTSPAAAYYGAPMPPVAPVPPSPLDDNIPYPGNRFPAGAIWLIGLGALFLLGNSGLFRDFTFHIYFVPILLIGLAVWLFVRKMTAYGSGLSNDGTAAYQLRLFRALRGSVWLALVGVLFLLDDFRILTWEHSWPLFIILAGVMIFFKRAAYSQVVAAPYNPYPFGTAPVPPAPVPPPSTSFVPANDAPNDSELRDNELRGNESRDQEGR